MTIRSFDVSGMTYIEGLFAAKDACQQRYHKAVKDRYDAWVRRDDLARSHAAAEARFISLSRKTRSFRTGI